MNRPARRTSSLGTTHPAAPPQPTQPQTAAPAREQPAEKPKKRGGTYTFHVDPDLLDRARGAYRYTQGPENYRSFSDFIVRAVQAEVERVEKKYNNGNPFESLEAGVLSPGRQA